LARARYRPRVAISDLRRRLLAGALLIAALFTVIQAVDYRQNVPSNDTYQYAKQTLRFLGDSPSTAVHDSVVMYCQDSGNAAVTADSLDNATNPSHSTYTSAYESCLQTYRNGLTPSSPRYLAIFTSRPGYPLLAAPIAAVSGLRFGLWAAAMLCTLLGGFLVLLLLRTLGCSRLVALGGEALFLAAPTGYWGSRMLTDGPSLTTVLLMLLGAVWLVRLRRTRTGLWLLAAGLVTGFVIRYSSEQMVALVLTLAALLCLWRVPSSRHRDMRLLALVSGVGFVLSEVLSTLLGWPGFSASLQDTFTKHFARPDVPDPLSKLFRLDLHYWGYFPVSEPTALLLVAGLATLAVLLVRRDPVYGVLVVAVALTGVGAVVAHPIASQSDRLMMPVWLLLVLGLPPLIRSTPAPSAAAEPAGGGTSTTPSDEARPVVAAEAA
jgi:hypothetical protein